MLDLFKRVGGKVGVSFVSTQSFFFLGHFSAHVLNIVQISLERNTMALNSETCSKTTVNEEVSDVEVVIEKVVGISPAPPKFPEGGRDAWLTLVGA